MEEEFSTKYVETGKERTNFTNVNQFDSLYLEVKEPDTAILLLKCKEKPILLSAAAALSKFGEKASANLKTLFDLKIVENIMPLINHEDIFTRRFTMKLLSQMASISNVKNYLLNTDSYVSRFSNLMTEESDIFMQEFSSRIIAELSTDLFGVERLAYSLDINILFELMKSSDPDIKRNCIEIVHHLLQDPFVMEKIITSENFNLVTIYEILNEPYQVIQDLALDVIKNLIEKVNNDKIQEMFRKSNGVDKLFDLLENDDWKDLHLKVLNIIALSSNCKKTAELIIFNNGVQKLFKYIEDIDDHKLYSAVLKVLVSLTKIQRGVKLLQSCEFVDHLLEKLQDKQEKDNYETICTGIYQMSLYYLAAKDFSERNTVQCLINIARDDKLDWIQRQSALNALKQLISFDIKNCEKISGLKLLIQELIEEAPINLQIICIEIVQFLLQYNQYRDFSINEYVDILCSTFDSQSQSADEVKMLCCSILSNVCSNLSVGNNENTIFNAMRLQAKKLFKIIKSDIDPLPVKSEALRLLILLCENSAVADDFVKNGCLIYMIQNRSPGRIIPVWDTCIEVLLNAHLPSKFAYSGFLTFHDITENGFYAMRRTTCPFPDLEEFFKMKMCPMEAIYVVNFSGANIDNGYKSEEIDSTHKRILTEKITPE